MTTRRAVGAMMAAVMLQGTSTRGREAALSIRHTPVQCMLAQRHPLLEVCAEPVDAAAAARVYFRAGRGAWNYVQAVKGRPGCYSASLPRPLAATSRLE